MIRVSKPDITTPVSWINIDHLSVRASGMLEVMDTIWLYLSVYIIFLMELYFNGAYTPLPPFLVFMGPHSPLLIILFSYAFEQSSTP